MFSIGNAFLANFSAWINPRDMDSPEHDSSARVDASVDPFDVPADMGPGTLLLSMFPRANIGESLGLLSQDLRAGKFDPLPPHIAKDLEYLPKDQNYYLYSYYEENGEEKLGWINERASDEMYDVGDPPFVDEAKKRVALELGGIESALVTPSRSLKTLFPNARVNPEEGMSTDDLRAGKFGPLPLQVAKDLEHLPKNETYYLRHLLNMDDVNFDLCWEPKSHKLLPQALGEPRITAEVKALRSQASLIMPDGVTSLTSRQFI